MALTNKEKNRENQRKYRKKHPEVAKEYYQRHKEKLSEKCKAYRKTEKGAKARKNTLLKSRYNVTLEFYEKLYKKQKGKCAICNQEKELHIDHNHKTEKIRGLLCWACNISLGYMKENIKYILNMIKYLKETE